MAEPEKPLSDMTDEERDLTREELKAKLRALELEAGRMPFFEHLRELRVRLKYSIISLIAGFAVAYTFSQELFVLLVRPLSKVRAELAAENPAVGESALHFTSLIEPFWTYFSVGFWGGLFLSSPFVFYNLWKFIAPGLYKNERRIGVAFAITSALLFIGGASFCYAFVLEPVYRFLLDYSSGNLDQIKQAFGEYQVGDQPVSLTPMLTMQGYLDFAKKILIGFGLAFELPLVIFFLSLIGAVDHRKLWKFNRWAVILAFLLAATLTPPDVVSQTFLAGPIVILYNLSIVVSWIVTRRREKREAKLMSDDPPAPDDDDGDES